MEGGEFCTYVFLLYSIPAWQPEESPIYYMGIAILAHSKTISNVL